MRSSLRILALILLAVPAVASAAPPGMTPSTDPAPPRAPAAPPPADHGENLKREVLALRAYTLTEELHLDEATAGKLFPILQRFDDETVKLLQVRKDLQRKLQDAGSLKDDRAIDKLIDAAVANQHAFWDLEDRRLGDLRKVLTPAQAARLVVVLPALERKIQNQLRKAAGGGGGANKRKGRARGAARPSDDDDDDAPRPAKNRQDLDAY